jgi:hypothetical protein
MPNSNRTNRALPAELPGAPAGLAPLALPIPQAMSVTGLSRSAIYREAGRGNLVLLKLGRSTLLCMLSARAFLASLPRASIRPPRKGAI